MELQSLDIQDVLLLTPKVFFKKPIRPTEAPSHNARKISADEKCREPAGLVITRALGERLKGPWIQPIQARIKKKVNLKKASRAKAGVSK